MISINATILVQILNLLVLIFILNKLMYKPIRDIMKRRQQQVEDGHKEVAQINQDVAQGRSDYQSSLVQGQKEVRDRMSGLKSDADQKAQQIIEQAQKKAQARTNEISRSIEQEIGAARQEIKKEAQAVASSLVNRILEREVA